MKEPRTNSGPGPSRQPASSRTGQRRGQPGLLTGLPLLALLVAGCGTGREASRPAPAGWTVCQGGKGATHYSALKQIDRSNVHRLEVAWTYHTGDKRESPPSTIECNPIVVDGVMYVTSPMIKVIALDAATGKELWVFDPSQEIGSPFVNRGVTYWEDGGDRRIFFVAGSYIFALDAKSGTKVQGFGEAGRVDLHEGLDRDVGELFITASSPGIIYKDLLIMGSAVGEGPGPAAPGHVRAYNVHDGRLAWVFHTIPHPGEEGYDTWPKDAWKTSGGANAWGGISLDEERGLVFLPTGSPSYDFFGGDRPGINLFSNCVLALHADTGKLAWYFQTTHHNLWDYDLPASPALVSVRHPDRTVDAVAQVTKTGHLFLLDRDTGKPLFPVEEKPVPAGGLEGEALWPTQPFPVIPPPFAKLRFHEEDATDISPEAREYVLKRLRELRGGDIYHPPTKEGTIMLPGFNGGAEWSGASFDPDSGILYIGSHNIPSILTMVEPDTVSGGERVYQAHCASCHGIEREGAPPALPPLIDIEKRLTAAELQKIIVKGQGQMPGFAQLGSDELQSLLSFLSGSHRLARWLARSQKAATAAGAEGPAKPHFRYVNTGYGRFVDDQGYPAVKPPWGTLTAIDLRTAEFVWQVPLGEHPELTRRGIPITGTENFGGNICTAGGLIFIGATKDEKFRAFDKETGKVLWETQLEAGGYATPSTYEIGGRQYVVIAAGGGGKIGTKSGDAYVAFALPK